MSSINQDNYTPAQRESLRRMRQGIATYGSLDKWLAWERENNPKFREKVTVLEPLNSVSTNS